MAYNPMNYVTFQLGADTYLFLINRYQSNPYVATLNNAATPGGALFKFDRSSNQFVEYQRFDFREGWDAEFITAQGNHFLILARGIDHSESIIYMLNLNTNYFEESQKFWTSNAKDIEVWSIGVRNYFMVSNQCNETINFYQVLSVY